MENKTFYTRAKKQQTASIHGVYPIPIFITKRDAEFLDLTEEKKEIEDIIIEGLHDNFQNSNN